MIAKTVYHTDCIDGAGAFRARAKCGFEDGLAFRRNDCKGGRDTSDLLGPHTVCTSGVCRGNTCKQILYHSGHTRSCLRLLKIKEQTCLNTAPQIISKWFHPNKHSLRTRQAVARTETTRRNWQFCFKIKIPRSFLLQRSSWS